MTHPERIECFVVKETRLYDVYLRRFASTTAPCPITGGYHNSEALLSAGVYVEEVLTYDSHTNKVSSGDRYNHHSPHWNNTCECGYEFNPNDDWQYNPRVLYADPAGKLSTLKDQPPGAMWRLTWLENRGDAQWCGGDGQAWNVRLPGGRDWAIDGRANNCTNPQENTHRCWCRHGVAPKFTVNKLGNTCEAGAGSIISGDYHGFLTDGFLVRC